MQNLVLRLSLHPWRIDDILRRLQQKIHRELVFETWTRGLRGYVPKQDRKPHSPIHGMFKVHRYILLRDVGSIGKLAKHALNSADHNTSPPLSVTKPRRIDEIDLW